MGRRNSRPGLFYGSSCPSDNSDEAIVRSERRFHSLRNIKLFQRISLDIRIERDDLFWSNCSLLGLSSGMDGSTTLLIINSTTFLSLPFSLSLSLLQSNNLFVVLIAGKGNAEGVTGGRWKFLQRRQEKETGDVGRSHGWAIFFGGRSQADRGSAENVRLRRDIHRGGFPGKLRNSTILCPLLLRVPSSETWRQRDDGHRFLRRLGGGDSREGTRINSGRRGGGEILGEGNFRGGRKRTVEKKSKR